jgi:hypothetical protein
MIFYHLTIRQIDYFSHRDLNHSIIRAVTQWLKVIKKQNGHTTIIFTIEVEWSRSD